MYQARPWNRREVKHEATARRWQNGRKEVRHSHALHRDERSEECMRHDVKKKREV